MPKHPCRTCDYRRDECEECELPDKYDDHLDDEYHRRKDEGDIEPHDRQRDDKMMREAVDGG